MKEKTSNREKIDFININELHNSTLEISKQSFEIKKICIATIGALNGFLLSKSNFIYHPEISNHKTDEYLILSSLLLTFFICVLFHITDGTTYYFQRKNREKQNEIKNKILLLENSEPIFFNKTNIIKSLFNYSMTMYYLLYTSCFFLMYLFTRYNVTLYLLILSLILIFLPLITKGKKKKEKIFVSYTTRDHRIDVYFLNWINGLLSINGYKCYIDLIHNKSEHKQEKVLTELISADKVLVLLSPDYLESEWTIKEIKIAKKLRKNILFIHHNDDKKEIAKKINRLQY